MYYLISLVNSPLSSLTYQSDEELKKGDVVKVALKQKEFLGVVLKMVEKPEFKCTKVISKTDTYYKNISFEVAKFISDYYVCSLGEAFGLMYPFSLHVKVTKPFTCKEKIELSSKQKEAKEFIKSHKASLLFGDTGSGKTEVYMSLMEEALQKGQNVIFLMPEIGLTPQTKKRLESHFGDIVAIWHSKITKKKKEEILAGVREGKIRILAGARSALFLPLENLGLIVVDEEHDDSYKSSSRPRYNARDLALYYGKKLDIQVILGSATPSLGSYKKLPHFRLKGTFHKSLRSFMYESAHNELTERILTQIDETLKLKKQVMVFLPTRANFKYLTCKDCGTNIECPYCSVGMSLHKQKNALLCHYCNFAMPIPQKCHSCGGETMEAKRIGTSEMVEQMRINFPEARVEKFDRDEVTTQRKLNTLLKKFNDKEIDILVGTQMLSKGHDYHDVSLCVVMGLDSILSMPDFRSRERALSLCLQISGRSGRKGEGNVLIQSMNNDFFSAYIDDYERFLKDELPFREEMYPPYRKLLRLLIAHKDEAKCQDEVTKVLQKIESLSVDVEVVGSGRSNIGRIANKHRYEVLLRSSSVKALLQVAHTCKDRFVEVDIDPLSFS